MSGEFFASACTGFRQSIMNRRHLLQIGSLGLLGLHLPGFLRAPERGHGSRARAKSVIFLHQYGGPSPVDTFDMKPATPDAIRGEFKPIATTAPGISVSEKLPRTATVMDNVSLKHKTEYEMKNHNSAG